MYVAFVAFGIVALLFLACNELLIEAKLAQSGVQVWWVDCMVFVGVYAVIVLGVAL